MNFIKYILFIILYSLFIVHCSQAQTTKIMGKVIDSLTKEPLPFVSIAFKGLPIGTSTDFAGNYSLEIKKPADSIIASYLGYIQLSKKVFKNKFQIINFSLVSSDIMLKEVVIRPGENPAEIILKKIIKNKDKNDCKKSLDAYQFETYRKIQFDANNISEKLKKKKLVKPFKFIFNYIDTSTINGKTYLPVFISELLSDEYYRKDPKSSKVILKATKMSGIKDQSITQFLSNMYLNINVYDNYIPLFDKNFISPVANFALGFYKYYLIDSSFISNKWCYKIMFKPRRKQELTFTGDLWVNDTTFAIKKMFLRIADDANVNFINDLVVTQEFELIDNKYWMANHENITADINIIQKTNKTVGFYGHKTSSYSKFIINKPKDDSFFSAVDIINDDSLAKPSDYWVKNRHDSLDNKEKSIYKMVDSLKNMALFKTYLNLSIMLTTGYYNSKIVEWGPYFSLYSFNPIEGNRFRFGGRTSNKFSKHLLSEAYIAYGTKDHTFKYEAGLLYLYSRNPRRGLAAYYKSDIEQLGESQNSLITDNIFNSISRRRPSDKLSMVKEFKSHYEYEWGNGLSNTFNIIYRDLFPVDASAFQFDTGNKQSITTAEVRIDLRYAYKERFVMGQFLRANMGSVYPVFQLQYSYGIKNKNILNSDYEYHKLVFTLEHWFNFRSFGWSKYIIEAGNIWGTLPYPLLKLHEGNETRSFDQYSFNMMNYYEFMSDKYLSAYFSHHFDGYFLNHIPLMRKLKWREIVYVKGVIGSQSNSNKNLNFNDANSIILSKIGALSELKKPYYETGVGIENIFKVFRIDMIYRLSYLDNPNVNRIGYMLTFQIVL